MRVSILRKIESLGGIPRYTSRKHHITTLRGVLYRIHDIRHFRNEKRTGAERHPAIVSGIVVTVSEVNLRSL